MGRYPAIGGYGPWYKPTARDLYDVDFLNIASTAAQRVVQAVRGSSPGRANKLPIWMGEGSPDWRIEDTSHEHELAHNLTFELFSTDMAASLARRGVGLYARQTLTSAIGTALSGGEQVATVTPAFWSALLWKRVMAEEVFAVTTASTDLRAYAHAARGGAGSVAVLLINRGAQALTAAITLDPVAEQGSGPSGCSAQEEYHVTAGPHVNIDGSSLPGILVNGKQPAFAPGAREPPPAFEPRRAPCGSEVTVAPRSWAFVVRSR